MKNWTQHEIQFLKENYNSSPGTAAAISKKLKRNLGAVQQKASKLELCGDLKTNFTQEEIQFIQDNYTTLTNQQIADRLNKTLTVVRNKIYELGICHIEMEYFTKEQTQFLIDNYKTTGDTELAAVFNKKFPKKKRWTKNHICKKRKYLKLNRTESEIQKIVSRNVRVGGPSHTIKQNSASTNLPDRYVANMIAWRNPGLSEELLQYPDLIDLKRKTIILNRQIKNHE